MTNEYSKIGDLNLKLLYSADNFNKWLFDEIKPFIRDGNILEIGSGIGTISNILINEFKKSNITLSDIDRKYIKFLRDKYNNRDINVHEINVEKFDHLKKLNKFFDTVIMLNVLEHIKDDLKPLENIYKILKRNGVLILLVPAFKFLYNSIDIEVGHYRRYSKKEIIKLSKSAGYKIKGCFYFNFLSIIGWFINGTIFRKGELSKNALDIYNNMIPLLRVFEKNIIKRKIGISIILILEK